jgi:dinuclear metal center YbgI/SA1388 family protein
MTVKEVVSIIEEFAPLGYQEHYDNSGLIIGSPSSIVNGILLTIDVTPEVIEHALEKNANLIIAHHPVIFSGIKRLNGSNYTELTVMSAIKNGISIYCAHTNIDSVWNGVSMAMANMIDLSDIKVLAPSADQIIKLSVFAPNNNAHDVRLAMFNAGAGQIGNYDQCSYNTEGTGTFRAGESTSPHVGIIGEMHKEPETKIEVIVPKPLLNKVIDSMTKSHPYEEVAYDIVPLLNKNPRSGLGAIGRLKKPIDELEFLKKIKKIFSANCIRHTNLLNKTIEVVALCGGSGASLLPNAIKANADIFITADFKYHQFFDAEGKILIADIGHFESEQFTVEIFYELLTKKLPNFAVLKSSVNTNPIKYL